MLNVGTLVATMEADMSKFEGAFNKVEKEIAGVEDAANKAEKALGGIGQRLSDFGSKATKVGAKMTAGFTLPVVGAGAAALKMSVDFNSAMANVASLIPKSAERVEELKKSVQDLAVETGKSTGDIAGGLYQVISAFGDSADTVGILDTNVRAAAAGLATTTDAINLTSAVTKGYGDTSANAVKQVADLAFQAVKLGQCVVGSTRILLADGRYERIDKLQDGGTVIAYDGRAFVPMQAWWVDQGTKPTVTLRTRLGREITTTWSHPYLAIPKKQDRRCTKSPKWRKVSELKIGDRVAVPAAFPVFGDHKPDKDEAGFLGLWLAEGSGQSSSPRLASVEYGSQIADWASHYGCTVKNVERRKGKCPQWEITADASGYPNGNPVQALLRRHGLDGHRSREKHIPQGVYTWDRDSVAMLLHWLFNGDGWLHYRSANSTGRRTLQLGFCSASERLVRDVSHLLLRFGIVGKVRQREGKWCWETQKYQEVCRFITFIGIDRPASKEAIANVPETQHEPYGVVHYDPIVAIEPGPEEHVYDLTVPGLHNFIAEDIVAHNTTFPELASSIGRVVPLAASLGVSQKELFGVMATATGVTGSASEVSTQLRGVLQALMAPSNDMIDVFTSLGYASGEAMLRSMGLQKTIETIVNSAANAQLPLQKLMGSIEGQTIALALAGPQAATFSEKLQAMQSTAGMMEEAFIEQTQGINATGFALSQLKQELATVTQQFGDALGPAIKSAVEAAKPLIDAVGSVVGWFTKLDPALQTGIIGMIGVVAALGPALIVIGQIAAGFAALGPVLAALTGPVGLAVAAIAGLIAGGVFIYKNWDDIKAFLAGVWQSIAGTAASAWDGIKVFFTDIWGGIEWIFKNLTLPGILMTHWDSIVAGVTGVFNTIKDKLSKIWTDITGTAKAALGGWYDQGVGAVADFGSGIAKGAESVMGKVAETGKNIGLGLRGAYQWVTGGTNSLANFVGGMGDTIGTQLTRIKEIGGELGSALWESIKKAFAAAKDFVLHLLANMIPSGIAGDLIRKGFGAIGLELPKPVKAQTGAILPGYGGGDRIPALVEAGEAIVPAPIVRGGIDATASWFRRMGVAGFQDGGLVDPAGKWNVKEWSPLPVRSPYVRLDDPRALGPYVRALESLGLMEETVEAYVAGFTHAYQNVMLAVGFKRLMAQQGVPANFGRYNSDTRPAAVLHTNYETSRIEGLLNKEIEEGMYFDMSVRDLLAGFPGRSGSIVLDKFAESLLAETALANKKLFKSEPKSLYPLMGDDAEEWLRQMLAHPAKQAQDEIDAFRVARAQQALEYMVSGLGAGTTEQAPQLAEALLKAFEPVEVLLSGQTALEQYALPQNLDAFVNFLGFYGETAKGVDLPRRQPRGLTGWLSLFAEEELAPEVREAPGQNYAKLVRYLLSERIADLSGVGGTSEINTKYIGQLVELWGRVTLSDYANIFDSWAGDLAAIEEPEVFKKLAMLYMRVATEHGLKPRPGDLVDPEFLASLGAVGAYRATENKATYLTQTPKPSIVAHEETHRAQYGWLDRSLIWFLQDWSDTYQDYIGGDQYRSRWVEREAWQVGDFIEMLIGRLPRIADYFDPQLLAETREAFQREYNLPPGFAQGGIAQMQTGTILPGFGGGDRIPALLEAGEAVVPAPVVKSGMEGIVGWFRQMGVPQMQEGGWLDPKGVLHVLDVLEDHAEWAWNLLPKEPNKYDANEALLNRGWARVGHVAHAEEYIVQAYRKLTQVQWERLRSEISQVFKNGDGVTVELDDKVKDFSKGAMGALMRFLVGGGGNVSILGLLLPGIREVFQNPWKLLPGGVTQMQTGGVLPGFGGGDRIPALLEAGEAVVPANIVRGGMDSVASWFSGIGVPKFAEGGVVKSRNDLDFLEWLGDWSNYAKGLDVPPGYRPMTLEKFYAFAEDVDAIPGYEYDVIKALPWDQIFLRILQTQARLNDSRFASDPELTQLNNGYLSRFEALGASVTLKDYQDILQQWHEDILSRGGISPKNNILVDWVRGWAYFAQGIDVPPDYRPMTLERFYKFFEGTDSLSDSALNSDLPWHRKFTQSIEDRWLGLVADNPRLWDISKAALRQLESLGSGISLQDYATTLTSWYESMMIKRNPLEMRSGLGLKGYASGGYTGGAMDDLEDIAGVVHQNEWVAPSWMLQRQPGVFRWLEQARKKGAFQAGGYTGGAGNVLAAADAETWQTRLLNALSGVMGALDTLESGLGKFGVSLDRGLANLRLWLRTIRDFKQMAKEAEETFAGIREAFSKAAGGGPRGEFVGRLAGAYAGYQAYGANGNIAGGILGGLGGAGIISPQWGLAASLIPMLFPGKPKAEEDVALQKQIEQQNKELAKWGASFKAPDVQFKKDSGFLGWRDLFGNQIWTTLNKEAAEKGAEAAQQLLASMDNIFRSLGGTVGSVLFEGMKLPDFTKAVGAQVQQAFLTSLLNAGPIADSMKRLSAMIAESMEGGLTGEEMKTIKDTAGGIFGELSPLQEVAKLIAEEFGLAADNAGRLNAELTNIPAGFKVEALRYRAMEPVPLKNGGIVREPTLALIGEAGPEVVAPLEDMFAEEKLIQLAFPHFPKLPAFDREAGPEVFSLPKGLTVNDKVFRAAWPSLPAPWSEAEPEATDSGLSVAVPEKSAGGSTTIIELNGPITIVANNPQQMLRELQRLAERSNVRAMGTIVTGAPNYVG